MIAGVLFTLPAASTSLAAIGEYSSPMFDEFLPLVYLVLGILIPVLVATIIISIVRHRG